MKVEDVKNEEKPGCSWFLSQPEHKTCFLTAE